MDILTKEFLMRHGACEESLDWVQTIPPTEKIQAVKNLTSKDITWSNWLGIRCMNRQQLIDYAAYVAENVVDIYEGAFPDETMPREAIALARLCIDNPTKENKDAATYITSDLMELVRTLPMDKELFRAVTCSYYSSMIAGRDTDINNMRELVYHSTLIAMKLKPDILDILVPYAITLLENA